MCTNISPFGPIQCHTMKSHHQWVCFRVAVFADNVLTRPWSCPRLLFKEGGRGRAGSPIRVFVRVSGNLRGGKLNIPLVPVQSERFKKGTRTVQCFRSWSGAFILGLKSKKVTISTHTAICLWYDLDLVHCVGLQDTDDFSCSCPFFLSRAFGIFGSGTAYNHTVKAAQFLAHPAYALE